MMKTGKEKAVSFFILLFSLFFLRSLYAQENAAEVYQKASSLFSDVSPFPQEEINKTIKNGWREDNEGLKEVLAKNIEAIEEFKRATKIAYCDFNFGKPTANDLIEMGPSHLKELNIAKLIILEAILYEREKRPELAIENYIAVIQYVRHLEQQEAYILLTKVTASVAEKSLYEALGGYFQQKGGFTVENYQSLLHALFSLKNDKLRITLKNAFEEEKNIQKNFITKLIDSPDFVSEYLGVYEIKQKNSAEADSSEKKIESVKNAPRKLNKNIRQAMYNEYNKISNEMHQYLIAAFRENDCSAFARKFKELRLGGLKSTPVTWFIYAHPSIIRNNLFQWMFPSAIAKTLIDRIVIIATPIYPRVIAQYYNSVSRLNILIVATAIKIYELEKGKAIDNLQELVPVYLDKIPEDPFDSFKPLKYETKENGWIVYSFGPDKQDDHAALEIDEEARNLEEAKGDIVFYSF